MLTTADASNTVDVTNKTGVITIGTAGTYLVDYGIWNSNNQPLTYVMTLNGTATTIANSAITASDQQSMTSIRYIRTFSANDTIRILCTGSITNTVPSVTTPLSVTAYVNIIRIA